MSNSFLHLLSIILTYSQALEKRPEVRFLEFHELPHFSLSSLTLRLQKLVPGPGKRFKTEHLVQLPARSSGMFLFSFSHEFVKTHSSFLDAEAASATPPVLPAGVLREIEEMAAGRPIEPSSKALAAHIADLEAELQSNDYRLLFFYHQRRSLFASLAKATRLAAMASANHHQS